MLMLVSLIWVLFIVAQVVSIMYFMSLGLMVDLCPSLRSVAKKSSLKLKLLHLTLIWCICFPVLRSMIFPSLTSAVLCMVIFLSCLQIPLMLSTLCMVPRPLLDDCPLRKSNGITMTIVCGSLSSLLLAFLLPVWLILSLLLIL